MAADQARRAPRALARAARGARPSEPPQRIGLSATQRPLDEIARFLGGFDGPSGPRPVTIVDAGHPQAARARGRRPGRGHGRARHSRSTSRPSGPAAAGPTRTLDLAVDPPAAPRADPRAPLHDRVRQRPPAGRAPRRALNELAERGPRARAPRLARARAAARGRGRAEGRAPAGDRRHVVARARHRHGRGRPRRPGRVAGLGRERAAAHRPRRPPGRRAEPRQDLPEVPRRPARGGGRRRAHARRR